MANNDYHFITHWQVQSSINKVLDVLSHATDLPRWWPSVYLKVTELEAGDPQTGIGKVVDLHTKGWLPYTLRWQFRITESSSTRYALQAKGDFNGRGIWTFEQVGELVNITYDWKISADKPILKTLSPLLKPIFSANHHWAMKMGLKSLKAELARRQLPPIEQAKIPAPRGGMTMQTVWGVVIIAGLVWLVKKLT